MDKLEQAREALELARQVVDTVAGGNRPHPSWGFDARAKIDAALASLSLPVGGVKGEPVAWPKIMYVCEYCQENNPEMCGHDRCDLYVTPGGDWLCEGCLDEVGVARVDCVSPPLLYAAPLANPEAEARLRERVAELERRVEFLTENRDHHFSRADKAAKEIERLQEYIAKSQKEVAETIADMRSRDKSVELRQRAEAAEARLAQAERVPADMDSPQTRWEDQKARMRAERGPAVTEAALEIINMRTGIEADVSTAHRSRGDGAAGWMREDDRDFRRDLKAAFDALEAALQQSAAGEEGKP